MKLARFLRRALVEEGYSADLCGSGADALAQARSSIYNAILLDWMLPDIDGLSVCRELRAQGVGTPILMLTARGEVQERVLGLQTGADDYMVKPFEVEELVARVQALLRRASGQVSLQIGELVIDPVGRAVRIGTTRLDLTTREYAFLLHLAHRVDRAVSRAELLSQVWEVKFDPGSNLVEVMVSRLRDKLGEHAWMLDTVRGRGYRLLSQRPE